MAKYIDRAKANEKNCQAGALQILYSLANYDMLKEPYRSWAAGLEVTPGEKADNFQTAMLDISESIIMFVDEISEEGHIL